jgi:RNA polymerase sigma-70 factor (ECF subfamily)
VTDPKAKSKSDRLDDDAALSRAMQRYAGGDELAFSELYAAMAPRLYGFLMNKTRNAAQAEDLVQETFLRLHVARERYLPGADIAPWIFSIARHLFIDMRRRAKHGPLLSKGDEAMGPLPEVASVSRADETLYSKELESFVTRGLRAVPEAQRMAFELVKYDGMSHAEAAGALGTTSTAVRVRVHRVCRTLIEARGASMTC